MFLARPHGEVKCHPETEHPALEADRQAENMADFVNAVIPSKCP